MLISVNQRLKSSVGTGLDFVREMIWTDLKVCPYWKEVIKRLEDYKKEILGVERRIEELKM